MAKTKKQRVLDTLNNTGEIYTHKARQRNISELRKVIYALRNEGMNIKSVPHANKRGTAKYVLV